MNTTTGGMKILVTGGAGYIGSHVAKELANAGHTPVVLDNFCRGHEWAVKWGPLLRADLSDPHAISSAFRRYPIDAVIHLAAFAYVGESMARAREYFRNNVANTQNLLEGMCEAGVTRIVFSSSCATYGDPQFLPITENHPQVPKSPYGESKWMAERMLKWYQLARGLSWTSLRYFNAAGADPECEIGELHDPEPHLIPSAIAAEEGDIPELEIFGMDYATHDGTAVRDFIHVTDLANAHLKAVERLCRGGQSDALNLGSGTGHSVHEVVAAVEKHGGRTVPVAPRPRRDGDPAILIADASRAAAELGWTPSCSSLDCIVRTAYRWYANLHTAGLHRASATHV